MSLDERAEQFENLLKWHDARPDKTSGGRICPAHLEIGSENHRKWFLDLPTGIQFTQSAKVWGESKEALQRTLENQQAIGKYNTDLKNLGLAINPETNESNNLIMERNNRAGFLQLALSKFSKGQAKPSTTFKILHVNGKEKQINAFPNVPTPTRKTNGELSHPWPIRNHWRFGVCCACPNEVVQHDRQSSHHCPVLGKRPFTLDNFKLMHPLLFPHDILGNPQLLTILGSTPTQEGFKELQISTILTRNQALLPPDPKISYSKVTGVIFVAKNHISLGEESLSHELTAAFHAALPQLVHCKSEWEPTHTKAQDDCWSGDASEALIQAAKANGSVYLMRCDNGCLFFKKTNVSSRHSLQTKGLDKALRQNVSAICIDSFFGLPAGAARRLWVAQRLQKVEGLDIMKWA